MNYFILVLTAYKATTQVIYDRFKNVATVCQVFKPMLKMRQYKELKWSHQAIFNLLRSAANIFLTEALGSFMNSKRICWKMKNTSFQTLKKRILKRRKEKS